MSKYILNFVIFFVVLAVGVVAYQAWYAPTENTELEDDVVIDSINDNQNNMENTTQGLEIEILQEAVGTEAKNGDNVSVHYTGTLTDGTKFDSSVDRGQPFEFVLGAGRVIQGWDLGVLGMKIGEKRKLTIAPELGYGSADMGTIPPNSTLIFEVELLGIN